MPEQTEFSYQETEPNPAPENDGATSSQNSSEDQPKSKTAPRKTSRKKKQDDDPTDTKNEAVSDSVKKRVVRRARKVQAESDVEPAAELTDASPQIESAPAKLEKPRKRATRKKKGGEPDATAQDDAIESKGTDEKTLGPTDQTDVPREATQAQSDIPEQEPAAEQDSEAKDSPPLSQSTDESSAPNEQDNWEGKRGRRFRNRRRGRDRFQRRDDFQANGDSAHTSESPQILQDENGEPVFEEGLVDVSGKGFGFLRKAEVNYDPSNSDTFITPEVVRMHNLRDGMRIKGQIRMGHRGPQLFKLVELEGEDPEPYTNLPVFEELTVLNPLERIRLETTPNRFTTRVVDLMAPIGKGTRGLLVAPPRTGKTTILQHIAEALAINHPDIKVIMLLVDERPEEVTELRRALPHAEVIASSNDSDIKSHTRIAQLGIDRAKRLVEMGKDVFVLMDSITRIGRAFNNAQSGKGRTMSGGVDSRALEIPRKLFAAARNTEEAGSLTIIGTALVETGSKMDDLIFLEFKGTGNMELVLDRKISDQRIYPAADIFMSGTRREELLIPADKLHKINIIRRGLAGHKPFEAIERLLFFLQKYPTNEEMLAGIPG